MNARARCTAAAVVALFLLACGNGGGDGSDSSSDADCGNRVKEAGELCDDSDHGGLTCDSLGLGAGSLICEPDCSGFDTSGCDDGCQKDCNGRLCGPDPVCGFSCGTCESGTCNGAGQCESSDPNGPSILSFSTNVSSITEGESITFTAVVTDPDGIDDLIGGTLSDPEGAAVGPFVTSAQEGAYSITVAWSQIDQMEAIEFEAQTARTFVATFFDAAGHTASTSKAVTLHCDGDGACEGTCVDLLTDGDHCGACRDKVADYLVCDGGEPVCPNADEVDCGTSCVNLLSSTENCGRCNNDCSAITPEPPGYTRRCHVGQCGFVTNNGGTPKSCSEYCGAQNSTCGSLDWNAWAEHNEYPWMPTTCGTGAGCFFYDYSSDDASCVEPLSCAPVPTATAGDCNTTLRTVVCFCE